MLFMQLLRCMCMPKEHIKKPVTFHFSLLIAVIVYAFMGGLVFNYLESSAFHEAKRVVRANRSACVRQTLIDNRQLVLLLNSTNDAVVDAIVDCWQSEADVRNEWSYMTATLYGFGVITTLGYNRIGPITTAGRLFCIIYGLCGIPIAMIILANVGQFLNQFACDSRRLLERRLRQRTNASKDNGVDMKMIDDDDNDESSQSSTTTVESDDSDSGPQITSLMLLGVFLGYVTMGAILLPLLNGRVDFFNGLYYNFLCLTAIDFGALIPQRMAFLPITLAYICVGLAITTIAIDVGSEYMKKLHYLGKRMKSAATTKIWFGGKTLKVRDLLQAVGKIWNVDAHLIAATDLNRVVEEAIARQEGRAVINDPESGDRQRVGPILPDSNDQLAMPTTTSLLTPPLPSRSPPPLSVNSSSHSLKSISNDILPSPQPPSIVDNRIERLRWLTGLSNLAEPAIDDTIVQIERETNAEPVVIESICEHTEEKDIVPETNTSIPSDDDCMQQQQPLLLIVEAEDEEVDECGNGDVNGGDDGNDDELRSPESSCSSIGRDDEAIEPKRFREKKEKYARDPHKLFETYSEEWNRLEKVKAKKIVGRNRPLVHNTAGSGGGSNNATSSR